MKARTMKEARDAGTMFNVVLVADPAHWSCCPAAETPAEAIECAQAKGTHWESRRFTDGAQVEVWRHLPSSRIGCQVIELVGHFTIGT